jgi:hypothetical protein
MKYIRLYESYQPEIANEWSTRKAIARDLLTLPQVYSSYITKGSFPSFRELMYRIWKNLTHENQSKLDRLEELGLFNPKDIELEQLMQLPGIEDIVQVCDTTRTSRTQIKKVNEIFPGLIVGSSEYEGHLNWGRVSESEVMESGETDITIVKGYIADVEGPNGEIPILVLNNYYVEAWVNINDLG